MQYNRPAIPIVGGRGRFTPQMPPPPPKSPPPPMPAATSGNRIPVFNNNPANSGPRIAVYNKESYEQQSAYQPQANNYQANNNYYQPPPQQEQGRGYGIERGEQVANPQATGLLAAKARQQRSASPTSRIAVYSPSNNR